MTANPVKMWERAPPTFGLYPFRAISGSFLNNLHKTALYWCDRLHPYSSHSPFWFESSRQSWQNATVSRHKPLFQGFNASFRSLGLVFAFSLYQRVPQACALLQKRSR
ncbi:hypothetical protein [Pseudomonas synxantha]|nr:hypothetical protein [Pseudomonas synxantha]